MPVLNGQRTIAGAINSVLSQTYENWELIIVSDGSTDDTYKEVAKFTDKRIRFFIRESSGIPATRNLGNQMAKGKYCIVQDADDYSLPDRLEKVIEVFKTTDADIVVQGAYVNAWNEQYGCLERRYSPPLSGKQNALENRINGWPAYKRGVWERKPFREETKYSYDWAMHLMWTFSGFHYATLDEGLYEYIRYTNSASDRFEKEGKRRKSMVNLKSIMKREYNVNIDIDAQQRI